MAVIILAILLIGLLLIATEPVNHINRAAVAMFAGVCCWIVYLAEGADFVASEHPIGFLTFLSSHPVTSTSVKEFISQNVFLHYAAQGVHLALFLLATTCIVEVLGNNGCFDFIATLLRTRRPRRMLWLLALVSFVISANLDNLTTVILLLTIVHPLLQSDEVRRIYGTVIMLAANCGGAITVIGDMASLKLWIDGLVTPTSYFLVLVLPVSLALCIMLLLLQKHLPGRIAISSGIAAYRGDNSLLSRGQRSFMLLVGIGGLWFIPTFHRITLMPPFVGAFCVLAFLWIVNELCNRELLGSDRMVNRRTPQALQYANLQNLLFFIGLTLMFGALIETGLLHDMFLWVMRICSDIYIIGAITAVVSSLAGYIPTIVAGVSLFNQPELATTLPQMAAEGEFWPLLGYVAAMGGCLLSTGTLAGIYLMRMENMTFRWYVRHITPKVTAGFVAGLLLMFLMTSMIY